MTEDGAILADREATDGCQAVSIQGFGRADLVDDGKDRGLSLLHIYGVRGLRPLALADGAARTSIDIVGLADPQNPRAAARRSPA